MGRNGKRELYNMYIFAKKYVIVLLCNYIIYCTDLWNYLVFIGGGEWPLLVSMTNQIHSLNEQVHTFAFDLLFARLKQKLADVPRLRVGVVGWAELVLIRPGGGGCRTTYRVECRVGTSKSAESPEGPSCTSSAD